MKNNTLKEAATGLSLMAVSLGAEAAASLPDPEQVNNFMSLLTQIAVLVITLWRTIKKPKP